MTKKKVVKLNNFDVVNLSISKEQFEKLNINQIKGETTVSLTYNGSPDGLDETNKKINVTKTIEEDGEFYKVNIKVEMPEGAEQGSYNVFDRIPSNMRFISDLRKNEVFDINNYYNIDHVNKQNININFYYNPKEKSDKNFSYRVRKIYDANAEVGNTFVGSERDRYIIWGCLR